MTPEQIERVFGRGRLKMVTGEHVEVFREAVAPGERRRYTKRFLNTQEGDFGQWTEREWRILARLIGHGIACVPDVVQFDRGRLGGTQLVQTYDAGVTVDQWATLLPVARNGRVYRHVFEDCAHWWALAHHCLRALDVIHGLELVHLDIKGDNVCIPYAPASFDPDVAELELQPLFAQLALIDFAFALISRESLATPLPIGWQKEYDYQSPRLLAALEAGRNGELQATRELDWRCDMYSLAAMLKRYLPEERLAREAAPASGWTAEHYDAARALILRVRNSHDAELPSERPHAALIEITAARLREHELQSSLECGWTLAREAAASPAAASPLTPVTRLAPVTVLAPPVQVTRSGRVTAVTVVAPPAQAPTPSTSLRPVVAPSLSPSRGGGSGAASSGVTGEVTPAARVMASRPRARVPLGVAALVALGALAATSWYLAGEPDAGSSRLQGLIAPVRAALDDAAAGLRRLVRRDEKAPAPVAAAEARPASALPPAGKEAAPTPSPPEAAIPAASAASATASAPPSSQAPREAPAPRVAQHRVSPARAPGAKTRRASIVPEKPANASSRPSGKPSRQQSVAAAPAASSAPPSRYSAPAASAPARRAHPAWASLQPPAWLHGGEGPGEPPARTAAESRGPSVTSSNAAAQAPAAPAAVVASHADSAQASALPAQAETVVAAEPPAAAPSGAASPLPASPSTENGRIRTETSAKPARGGRSGAPIEDRSESIARAMAPVASAEAAPLPRSQIAAPPVQEAPGSPAAVLELPGTRAMQGNPPPDDLAELGRRTLAEMVPRIAARAEPEVARVLWMAGNAAHPMEDRAVADAAQATHVPDDADWVARTTAPREAHRLNDQALALGSKRNVVEALNLQLRAFGANPRDPAIAGNLALLYLRMRPSQPETARQVALVAIAARAPQFHTARMEDWQTFAVASALAGREADARNAWLVTLALSANAEQRCAAALNVLVTYGERMRRPIEAMFSRIHARNGETPGCAWPPNWAAVSRVP